MKKDVIVEPDEITQTLVRHPEDPDRKSGYECLDKILVSGNPTENVPAITLVDDNGKFLVYCGTVRVMHAKEHGYSLKADIIENASDLRAYINEYQPHFFNIRDFNELLTVMRIYANSPRYDQEFTKEDLALVKSMQRRYDGSVYLDMDPFSGWYKTRKKH